MKGSLPPRERAFIKMATILFKARRGPVLSSMQQPGRRKLHGDIHHIGSSPIYEMHLEVKDWETFAKIRSKPDFDRIGGTISDFLQNPVRRFLLPQRTNFKK